MAESDIVLQDLEAFSIREAVGANGLRSIAGEDNNQFLPDWLEGLGGAIWDMGTKLVGFACGAIGAVFEFTCTKVWGALVSYSQFVWNFNWDASDDQLDGLLSGLKVQIGSQVGGTLGNLAGYLVCGVVPGAVMLKFNKMLAVRILKEVGEEALEELAGNLSALCQTALNGFMQWYTITMFKCGRRMIKNFFNDPNSTQSRFAQKIFGENFNNAIKGWGDGKDNWTFANLMEEAIDKIPIDWLRAGVEEFVEEFAESCIEAGFIVAGELDQWATEQKTQREAILGEQKIVEVIPNREADSEKLVLAGNEAIVRATLPVVLSTHQQVENRDIGQFMGSQMPTYIKKDRLLLGIKIVWKSKAKPPWGKAETVDCSIEGIDRSKLEWDIIKILAGGENGFMWGRFRATANLSNGGQLVIHGATKDEAEDMAKKLIQLSEFDILTLSVTEHLKEGLRGTGQPLEIDSKRVYPAYLTIINQQKVINEASAQARGVKTLTGTYKQRSHQLNLWTEKKPRNFDDIVQELLHNGTGTA